VLIEAGQTRGDLGTHPPRGAGHRKPVDRPERPGSVLARILGRSCWEWIQGGRFKLVLELPWTVDRGSER